MLLAFFVSTFIVISGFHSHYLRLLVESSDADSSLTFAFSVITLAFTQVYLLTKLAKGDSDDGLADYRACLELREIQHGGTTLAFTKSPFCDLLKDCFSFLFSLGLHFHFSTWNQTRPTVTLSVFLWMFMFNLDVSHLQDPLSLLLFDVEKDKNYFHVL